MEGNERTIWWRITGDGGAWDRLFWSSLLLNLNWIVEDAKVSVKCIVGERHGGMKAELWSWVKKEDHEVECNAAGHDQCFASKVGDTWERLWPWKSHWEANLEFSAHRTTGPRTLYSQYATKPVKGFKQEVRWSYVSQFTLTTDKHELEGRKEQNQWYLFAMVHKSDENESDLGGDWIWREVNRFRRYLASK